MTALLRPTAPIAAAALLTEDPAIAMALAQRELGRPRMSNHHHGLWGYVGETASGLELTVQATGFGAPSAAAVFRELAEHGVRAAVRVGRCSALAPAPAAGECVRVVRALGGDGVSLGLRAAVAAPDPELDAALAAAAPEAQAVAIAGYDLEAAEATPATRAGWLGAGALVADLETAALLALGERLGVAAAAALVVVTAADGAAVDEEQAEARVIALGGASARALEAHCAAGRDAVAATQS